MTIPLNDREVSYKVISIKKVLDQYWKNARIVKTSPLLENFQLFHGKAKQHAKDIVKLLGGDNLKDLEVAFKATYGWDTATWTSFRVSALSVHTTLVPTVLSLIAANKEEILKMDVDSETGRPYHSGSLTPAVQASIVAALQAVEDEYTL